MGTVKNHAAEMSSVRAIRARVFSKDWPLDKEICEIAETAPSHNFLANPSGQYAFVYLTRFVKELSERYFDVPFSQLDVLDWGCGKGHVSKLLHDLGPKRLQSCDLLSGADDSAFGQDVPIIIRCNIQVTPLEHEYILPYESASFDVVLSVGVLEHVCNESASLAEISRILKPGGLFFCFFLPAKFSWNQKIYRWMGGRYHDRFYTQRHIREMLCSVGLQPLDIWYRQLFPKNSVHYPMFRSFEKVDLLLTQNTLLRYFATNVEFVSAKGLRIGRTT